MKTHQNTRFFPIFLRFTAFSVALVTLALLCGRAILPPSQNSQTADASTTPILTVIVDAGHGGRDGGASAEDGTLEKNLNLAVAKKLAALLRTANVNVLMTRNEDIELADPRSSHKKRDDLNARLAMGNGTENALFVSIHMNKFPVEKYSGLQVYYSPNHEKSRSLAEAVQKKAALLDANNTRKAGKADSAIYLLAHLQCPAVLVECGFLSNRREAALLQTSAYQEKLAMTVYAAILDYISGEALSEKEETG